MNIRKIQLELPFPKIAQKEIKVKIKKNSKRKQLTRKETSLILGIKETEYENIESE